MEEEPFQLTAAGPETDKDTWLTPKRFIDTFGPFDLDPCASSVRPFDCATRNLTKADDGLRAGWEPQEFVWCNPPYSDVPSWVKRMAEHKRTGAGGIMLLFARTDAVWFQQTVFAHASALVFVGGRVSFLGTNGQVRDGKAPMPSVLIGFGLRAAHALEMGSPEFGGFVRIR